MQDFSWITSTTPKENLVGFINHLKNCGINDLETIYKLSWLRYCDLRKGTDKAGEFLGIENLEKKWYDSLRITKQADYSVYDDDLYLAEVWACWVVFSRHYLKEITKPTSFFTHSVWANIAEKKKIVDLGCGIGFSTAALKIMTPSAQVIGTNLESSSQFKIANELAKSLNFRLTENLSEIGSDVDIVFASEYFEHFDKPIEHLLDVVSKLQPKNLLLANAFTANAIGHFDSYWHEGKQIPNTEISSLFNKQLKLLGYEKQKTKLWNNRPSYWKKKNGNYQS